MSMTTLEALRYGRTRIEDPRKWCKAGSATEGGLCASLALPDKIDGRAADAAFDALKDAAGTQRSFSDSFQDNRNFYRWHDAPERTHAEVLAIYDAAIATESEAARGQ